MTAIIQGVMPKVGFKFSPESIERLRASHLGQVAWNKNRRSCGHDPKFHKRSPSGNPYCLMCKREFGLRYREANREKLRIRGRLARYKLTPERFEEIWQYQNGCCAICLRTLYRTYLDGRHTDGYRIDHDASDITKVRGILCHSCNTGIGMLQESTDNFQRAIQYLQRGQACPTVQRPDKSNRQATSVQHSLHYLI